VAVLVVAVVVGAMVAAAAVVVAAAAVAALYCDAGQADEELATRRWSFLGRRETKVGLAAPLPVPRALRYQVRLFSRYPLRLVKTKN
jgi:hypothetical protein